MPTGADVVTAALQTLQIPGIHYDQCGSRCHPDQWPHCTDCSGFTTYVLNRVGIAHGCDGSFAQSRTIHAAGTRLTIDQAFKTPGAFVFRGINEGQGGIPGVDPGHVGISIGDDQHSAEARSHYSGVGVFPIRSLTWDFAGIWPGISTGAPSPPPPLPPPPAPTKAPIMPKIVTCPKSTPGYWICHADGAVFSYGSAKYHGGANAISRPGGGSVTDMTSTTTGDGYWQIDEGGGVYAFGDAKYLGHP